MKRPLIFTSSLLALVVVAMTGAAIPAAADLGDAITAPGITVETPVITVGTPPVTVPPVLPDPTPTPTQPAPTPTNPAPAPRNPAPTPTNPAPAPSNPAPSPTATSPAPAANAPAAPATPAAQGGTAAAPTANAATGGTPTASPSPAAGATPGATAATPTATGPGGLWSQYPLDAAATTPTAATPVAGVTPAATAPAAGTPAPATSVPADPSQPALPAPAASNTDSEPGSDTWPLWLLGALVLAGLVALAARRRRNARPALVAAVPTRRPAVVTDPSPPQAARLEQCHLRWRRGFLRARFEAIATTPDGEARIGSSAGYWAVRDRRTTTSGLAYLGLLQALREAGWHDAPATSLWYRAPRLGPGGQWYERRLERDLAARPSAVAQLDSRNADVAVSLAG
jgi:MYXO-CTERM domain-containing protein